MNPSKIILACLCIGILFYVGIIIASATQEPKKNCTGNVWNVEIYYSDELGLWVGEFDTFVGKRAVHAIAGSSKDKETIEKAINSYCR